VAFHLSHGTTTTMASTVTGALPDLERYVAELAELVEDGLLAGIPPGGSVSSPAPACGCARPEPAARPGAGETCGGW